MTSPTPEELLDMVREYARYHNSCNIHDYEHYKQMFLDHGYYGYESKIARILNI